MNSRRAWEHGIVFFECFLCGVVFRALWSYCLPTASSFRILLQAGNIQVSMKEEVMGLCKRGSRKLFTWDLVWRGASLLAGMRDYSNHLEGPLQRSSAGTSIQLKYSSSKLPTQHVTVTWLKNNHSHLQTQTNVFTSGNTYSVTSSVLVPLESDDILSSVLCRVEHKFSVIFQKVINLDQYLSGKAFLFLAEVMLR